jgi:hypothetical protein
MRLRTTPTHIIEAVVLALIAGIALSSMLGANAQATSAMSATLSTNATVTLQGTAMSTVDTLPGHEHHQAVVVLPARTDGKIWVGTISWTASKPVEVRLLYDYNSTVTPDAIHGKPATAAFGTGEAAISLIKPLNSGAEAASFNSGSLTFAAKQAAFHTIDGTPFTVTYAVDAVAK